MECLAVEMREKGLNNIRFTTIYPYFVRTPMILEKKMRPTSALVPFMSVSRCSNEVVDAILKEKTTAFIPSYIATFAMLKWLLSNGMLRAARDFMNCRYEPFSKSSTNETRKESESFSLHKMTDYFQSPHFSWFIIIPAALLVNFITWYKVELLPLAHLGVFGSLIYYVGVTRPALAVLFNLFALIAHLSEAIYSLHLCNRLDFSQVCTFKWFIQTFLLGFPSLRLLQQRTTKLN
ncbi:hypothetical protein AB6A40_005538 [Gnathostoma spinigerum]|uniref:Transmembrane protein 254 n=1 Tax=Gnathostoma spinigerum TaxID=75299 RepID=A0ABD6END1_9BILA